MQTADKTKMLIAFNVLSPMKQKLNRSFYFTGKHNPQFAIRKKLIVFENFLTVMKPQRENFEGRGAALRIARMKKGRASMAIYHCHCKVIGRGQGRSAVGASAYRSGEKLTNEYDGLTHDYTNKNGVVYSEIMLCENAPKEWNDRTTLWNTVELSEKDSRARLAREYEIALPKELNREEQIELVREYVRENFVKQGMCADVSIHDKGDGNPHAHIMLTVRPIDENGKWEAKTEKVYLCKNTAGEEKGFTAAELKELPAGEWEKQLPYFKNGNPKSRPVYLTKREAETNPKYKDYSRVKGKNDPKKQREDRNNSTVERWDSKEFLNYNREEWANTINRELQKKNIRERVSEKSLKEQGIERIPTTHIGVAANGMEQPRKKRAPVRSDRGEMNREIKATNAELEEVKKEISETEKNIGQIKEDMLWMGVHQSVATIEKRIKETARDLVEQTFLKEHLANVERTAAEVSEQTARTNYHADSVYTVSGKEIGYWDFHTSKVEYDIEYLKKRISQNLSEIQKKDAPQQTATAQTLAQTKREDLTGADLQRKSTEAQTETFDVVAIARQLEAHRAAFVRATEQAAGRKFYQENPIYRQQATQIAECSNFIKDYNASIESLRAEKEKLGLFKGKQKKELQRKIDYFERLRREKETELKALGVAEPSKAEEAIKEKNALAAQEQAKAKAARENAGASARAEEAKIAYLALAKTVPAEQRPAVLAQMERIRGKEERGVGTMESYRAKIEADKQLDVVLKPVTNQKQKEERQPKKNGRGWGE